MGEFRHRIIAALMLILVVLAAGSISAYSQKRDSQKNDERLRYVVVGKYTVYLDQINPSKVYSKMPRQKGREWRKYYRLVHNFGKTYPYALVAKKIVNEADSTIEADGLKGIKREKYINSKQKELFNVFEKPLRNLTVSQGALLMKLIDREAGKSSYMIIKDYKSGIAAGFWQHSGKISLTESHRKHPDAESKQRYGEESIQSFIMWRLAPVGRVWSMATW